MRLVTLPGVFRPISDTWLLGAVLAEEVEPGRSSVLDVCTGSGALAIAAARRGAATVTAVDLSRRAVATARINAWLNGVAVRTVRSDLLSGLDGARFDVIVSNPPYVPAPSDRLPAHAAARAWDAGRNGRLLLDRLLAAAPDHLRPGGTLLVVHSEVCGIDATLRAMRARRLDANVAARHRGPLGPLMRTRIRHLESHGLLPAGRREEEVAVLRGRAPTH